ncbi:MAG: pilus assembly protein PilP [Kingella sp. (in: b-proteobacteria)]|jgi:pilP
MKLKFLLLSSVLVLAACSESHSDLQAWMKETRTAAKAKIKPVEAPAPIEPATYNAPQLDNPPRPNAFNAQRLRAAFQANNSPDLKRPKELLENYSLENLKYVGYIGTGPGTYSAMIEADGHVYTIKPGAYVGQNFGKVTEITPAAVKVVEVVEDTFGNWNNQDKEIPLDGSVSFK